MNRRMKQLGSSAAVALALGLGSRDASACGGLFCSSANPVNQAAERIVFAHDEVRGEVTAIIEILYQGPSERFAWILPVAGEPAVSVSTNAILNRLQQATNPNYQLQRTWPDDACNNDFANGNSPSPSGTGGIPPSAQDPSGESAVSVVASGSAGPYDYQVISVAPGVGDPAQEAITWLQDNQYDTGATGPDLLRPYLENGLNLLAVRLSKQASVGSIRPIRITYASDEPMIPIKPTAVAANDDMGILVWVLGSSRAVPFNYKTLELNEALIDWFNPQQAYNDVIIAAANETGDGQGFVTEVARPTNDPNSGPISSQLFTEQYTIQEYRGSADSLGNAELIVDVIGRFATFNQFAFTGPFGGATATSGRVSLDGVSDVIARNVTLPMGVSAADVMSAPRCYFDEFTTGDAFYCEGRRAPEERIDLTSFDRTAFLNDVENFVIRPIEDTVQLFADLPYMTRFYTTLSADEMTVDPLFTINSDLSDVSNQHTLDIEYEGCFGDTSGAWEASVGGRIVRGEGNTWPLTLQNRPEDMPVNLRILQLSAGGNGEVFEDNGDLIDMLLGELNSGSGSSSGNGSGTGVNPPSGNGSSTIIHSDDGCSLGSSPARSTLPMGSALTLLGLLALRRRTPRAARRR